MKKAIIMLTGLAMCAATVNAQGKNAGKLQFKAETHDFGDLKEGPDAEYDFVVTNTGKSPVVIKQATTSCGCTASYWSHNPILPGKSDKVHVVYHTKGRTGPFTKDVTILSDAEQPQMFVHIKGTVKANALGADVATNKGASK